MGWDHDGPVGLTPAGLQGRRDHQRRPRTGDRLFLNGTARRLQNGRNLGVGLGGLDHQGLVLPLSTACAMEIVSPAARRRCSNTLTTR